MDKIMLQTGMHLKVKETHLPAVVAEVYHDTSCCDPGCCGGPFPDVAWIRCSCGHVERIESDHEGMWEGFEIMSDAGQMHPDGLRGVHHLSPIRSFDDLTYALEATTNPMLRVESDAHAAGIVLIDQAIGPVARIGWHALTANPELANEVRRIAPEIEIPVAFAQEDALLLPEVGQRVVELATGQHGVIEEVVLPPPGARWWGSAYLRMDCGHSVTLQLEGDGSAPEVALLQG